MTVSQIKKPIEALDTKQAILDKIGDLSEYQIAPGEVLLAIYRRPEMSAGGIVMVSSTLKEDIYQGKAHLVLKIGEGCDFFGLPVKLHDWVVVRPSDGWALDINTRPNVMDQKDFVSCRMTWGKHIRAIIPHPSVVW